jgi:hypothetical protein
MYGVLADGVVLVHVLYVAFVIVGQLFIILAASRRWECGRNPWFRFSHLLAIGIVALEAMMKWRCPLTVWEEQLRALAGQSFNSSDTFMGRLLHNLLFIENQPEIFFTTMYIAMFAVVLQGLLMYPPRLWKSRESAQGMALPAGV